MVAVLLRTLYVYFHTQEPVAFAGTVGLTAGIALILIVLVVPSAFESSWGSEAKELFQELAALLDDLTYTPPTRPASHEDSVSREQHTSHSLYGEAPSISSSSSTL